MCNRTDILAAEGQTSDVDSELGVNWGPSSPVPTAEHPDVAAIRAASEDNEGATPFIKAAGERPDLEVERALADEAIKLINSTVGNLDKRRYVLVVLNMKDVDPETTGAAIEDYSLVATSDMQSFIQVAQNEAYKLFYEQTKASALEV